MATAKGRTTRVVVWIILGLLVVGLAGFGTRNFGGRIRSVGQVGDTDINVDRYARALSQELRALAEQSGQDITLSQAQQFGFDRGVLQRLIATAALENEVTRLGLSVGDREVQQQVLAIPAFAGQDGQFDRDAYEFTLDRTGQTAAEFEAAIRVDRASTILQAAVSAGVVAPAAYADIMLAYIGERRNFSWLELNAASLSGPIGEPNEAELLAYYDANPDAFQLPAFKRLTYAWLSPEFVTDQIEVDDDELRALYDERSDIYNLPERRLVERLVFATLLEADAALADIRAGTATFGDYVRGRGLSLQDVDLGAVTRDDLGAAADAVFGLAEPGVAEPVDTDLGPALIRVNAILRASTTSFEDAREALREELVTELAGDLIADQITEMDDLLAGGATLEDLASETDIQLGRINWSEGSTDGIAAIAGFAQAAASIQIGEFPEIAELSDGGIFALRLDELVPARPEPFADARARVEDAWRAAELAKRLRTQAESLVAKIDAGVGISSLGYPVAVQTHITRNDFIAGAPAELLIAVFALNAGQSIVIEAPGTTLIAQLAAVLPAATDNPDLVQLRARINDDTAQSIAQDALAAFTRALELQAGISLNPAALNAVHAQFR
ncbi:MAG: peptidyl-prolyl cis-trans isomerase [Paracoccaceae bacterium]